MHFVSLRHMLPLTFMKHSPVWVSILLGKATHKYRLNLYIKCDINSIGGIANCDLVWLKYYRFKSTCISGLLIYLFNKVLERNVIVVILNLLPWQPFASSYPILHEERSSIFLHRFNDTGFISLYLCQQLFLFFSLFLNNVR